MLGGTGGGWSTATSEAPLAAAVAEPAAWLASTASAVPPVETNTSTPALVSVPPATRLVAAHSKATKVPLTLITAGNEMALAVVVALPAAWLTSVVTPVAVLYRNTSVAALASVAPVIRLVASDWKTTNRPSPETTGSN